MVEKCNAKDPGFLCGSESFSHKLEALGHSFMLGSAMRRFLFACLVLCLASAFLAPKYQCCHVDAHKDTSILATHWGLKPEP